MGSTKRALDQGRHYGTSCSTRLSLTAVCLAALVFWPSAAAANPIQNPSFSANPVSPPTWSFVNSTHDWPIAGRTGSGDNAVRVIASNLNSPYRIQTAVDPVTSTPAGYVYQAGAWVRGTNQSDGKKVTIKVVEKTQAGVVVGSKEATTTLALSTWKWFETPSNDRLTPATGNRIEVRIIRSGNINGGGESFRVDDVFLGEYPPAGGCNPAPTWNAHGYGSFSADTPPGACWRPFSSSSPFNKSLLAADSTWVEGTSALQVAALTSLAWTDRPGAITAGTPSRDHGVPIYFSDEDDSEVTLDCVRYGGACDVDGRTIHIPAGATPAGLGWTRSETTVLRPNGDGAMTWEVASASGDTQGFQTLDEAVTRPGDPDYSTYIWPAGLGKTAEIDFADFDIGYQNDDQIAKVPIVSRVWFFAHVGSGTSLKAELLFQRNGVWQVQATKTITGPADSGWRGLFATPRNQTDVNSLRVRFTTTGGSVTAVRAAYAELETATNRDAHISIIDQSTDTQYDLYQGMSLEVEPTNGVTYLRFANGAALPLGGTGVAPGAATAAEFSSIAGAIRPEELAEGQINHALVLTIPCTNGTVWPATKGATECSALQSQHNGTNDNPADPGTYDDNWQDTVKTQTQVGMPANGALLRYDRPQIQIDALAIPDAAKTILTAFREYGAYVGDTTAARTQWAFRVESPTDRVSQGEPDPWVAYLQSEGLTPTEDGTYYLHIGDGVFAPDEAKAEWEDYLKVIKPCKVGLLPAC